MCRACKLRHADGTICVCICRELTDKVYGNGSETEPNRYSCYRRPTRQLCCLQPPLWHCVCTMASPSVWCEQCTAYIPRNN